MVVSLCPGAIINIQNPIYFYYRDQQLSTRGYPTNNSRATIIVMGPQQSTAIDGLAYPNLDNVSVRNIVVNGNRPALGRIVDGNALMEMGGQSDGQIVDSVRVYEPRGWSALHAFGA